VAGAAGGLLRRPGSGNDGRKLPLRGRKLRHERGLLHGPLLRSRCLHRPGKWPGHRVGGRCVGRHGIGRQRIRRRCVEQRRLRPLRLSWHLWRFGGREQHRRRVLRWGEQLRLRNVDRRDPLRRDRRGVLQRRRLQREPALPGRPLRPAAGGRSRPAVPEERRLSERHLPARRAAAGRSARGPSRLDRERLHHPVQHGLGVRRGLDLRAAARPERQRLPVPVRSGGLQRQGRRLRRHRRRRAGRRRGLPGPESARRVPAGKLYLRRPVFLPGRLRQHPGRSRQLRELRGCLSHGSELQRGIVQLPRRQRGMWRCLQRHADGPRQLWWLRARVPRRGKLQRGIVRVPRRGRRVRIHLQ